MEQYKDALAIFCKWYTRLVRVCEKAVDGEVIDIEKSVALAQKVAEVKSELEAVKNNEGFSSGLAFLEDANYRGFRIENGQIVGSKVEAFKMANDYCNKFAKGTTPEIFYEVANLIFFLVEPDIEEIKSELRKEQQCNKRVA